MLCRGIEFPEDKLRILCNPHCDFRDHEDPEGEAIVRQEEDIWNAMEVLARLVVHQWPEVPPMWVGEWQAETWQNYLMHLLKPVAKHYDVSPDAVLGKFVEHYMPTIVLSGKHGAAAK